MLNSWRDSTIDFNAKAVLFRNPPQWVCSHSIPKRLNYRSESISPLNKTWTVNRTAIQIVSGSRNTSRAMTFEKASCCCIAEVFPEAVSKVNGPKLTHTSYLQEKVYSAPLGRGDDKVLQQSFHDFFQCLVPPHTRWGCQARLHRTPWSLTRLQVHLYTFTKWCSAVQPYSSNREFCTTFKQEMLSKV